MALLSQLASFFVTSFGEKSVCEDLNQFLKSHRIVNIEKGLSTASGVLDDCFWSNMVLKSKYKVKETRALTTEKDSMNKNRTFLKSYASFVSPLPSSKVCRCMLFLATSIYPVWQKKHPKY